MHELSVVYPIVQMAARLARDNGIERVTCVRLAVGEIHDLVDEYVFKYYDRFSKGTPLEGSRLKMRRIPIVYRCSDGYGVRPRAPDRGDRISRPEPKQGRAGRSRGTGRRASINQHSKVEG